MKRLVWPVLALLFVAAAAMLWWAQPVAGMQAPHLFQASASGTFASGTFASGTFASGTASWSDWFGFGSFVPDVSCRERMLRLAAAAVFGCVGAMLVSLCTTAIAIAAGTYSAFAPLRLRRGLLLATDALLTLPWLCLLLLLRSALPLGTSAVGSGAIAVLLLACLGWPAYVRSLYMHSARIRAKGWLEQSRATSVGFARIALRRMLPHLGPLYRTQFLLCIPACLLAESRLASLGQGAGEQVLFRVGWLRPVTGFTSVASTPWLYLPMAGLVLALLSMEFFRLEE